MWLSALCFGQCVCCLDEVGARLHHAPCQSPQCAGRLYERGSRSRLFWAVTDHQCLSKKDSVLKGRLFTANAQKLPLKFVD